MRKLLLPFVGLAVFASACGVEARVGLGVERRSTGEDATQVGHRLAALRHRPRVALCRDARLDTTGKSEDESFAGLLDLVSGLLVDGVRRDSAARRASTGAGDVKETASPA